MKFYLVLKKIKQVINIINIKMIRILIYSTTIMAMISLICLGKGHPTSSSYRNLKTTEWPEFVSNLRKLSNKRNRGSEKVNYLDNLVKGGEKKCKNPHTEFLDDLLLEHQKNFNKEEEELFDSMNNPITQIFTKSNDTTHCEIYKRNFTTLHGRSLCPWIYENVRIPNRFPHLRSSVKCTCDSCITTNETNSKKYSCYAVSQRVPILEKGNCGSRNYFKWKKTFDEVNVACICGLTNKYTPH